MRLLCIHTKLAQISQTMRARMKKYEKMDIHCDFASGGEVEDEILVEISNHLAAYKDTEVTFSKRITGGSRIMIEFSNNQFIYQLEQNTVKDSNCTLKIFDKDYNLIKTRPISIEKLSDFVLSLAYK